MSCLILGNRQIQAPLGACQGAGNLHSFDKCVKNFQIPLHLVQLMVCFCGVQKSMEIGNPEIPIRIDDFFTARRKQKKKSSLSEA